MFNKDRIINFDSQGFPLEEQTLKDIIEQICSYDEKTNRYYIDADDKTLNIVPRVLEDDGMGYGVNEKHIISFSVNKDYETPYANAFIEKPLENIDMWLEGKFFYGCFVRKGRTLYITRDIRKTENGTFEYLCERMKKEESIWISEDKLEFEY